MQEFLGSRSIVYQTTTSLYSTCSTAIVRYSTLVLQSLTIPNCKGQDGGAVDHLLWMVFGNSCPPVGLSTEKQTNQNYILYSVYQQFCRG